jgi:hypothetical protein
MFHYITILIQTFNSKTKSILPFFFEINDNIVKDDVYKRK